MTWTKEEIIEALAQIIPPQYIEATFGKVKNADKVECDAK